MKTFLLVVVAALASALLAVPALAETTPPPVQGKQLAVMLYADTVQNSHPKYGVVPQVGCSITNLFRRGNGVVFRVWGIEAKTGLALTPDNVKYAYVSLPNPADATQPTLMKLAYGAHGKGDAARSFWTAAWDVAPTYPLGVVPFKIVFKTKANKLGVFNQLGTSASSQLTITP